MNNTDMRILLNKSKRIDVIEISRGFLPKSFYKFYLIKKEFNRLVKLAREIRFTEY